ncbi:MAG: hypothetical protein WC459_00715 [Patescibacteria group bacterium]
MIIFLYGSDILRAREKLDELKRRFLEKNNGNSFLISLISGDPAEFNLAEFRNKVLSAGFFAEKKMVIFNYELRITNYELEIIEIIKKISKETVLVIWNKDENEKFLKSDLGKYLLKQKYVFEFNPLSGNALVLWIRERAKNYGCEIDNEAIAEICDILGSDLWKIDLELSKLCAYARSLCHSRPLCRIEASESENPIIKVPDQLGGIKKEKQASITKKNVAEMLTKEVEDNIFKFIDALAAKNKRLALLALEDEFRAGAPELQILGAVSGQVRTLIQTKSLLERGAWRKEDLAKKIGVHPYVAQKSLAQVKNFQLNELKNIYRQLLAVDISIKNSTGSAKALFFKMVARI